LYNKKSFYSSLPFLFVLLSCMVFPFCNDHQGSLGVSRYGNFWRSHWRRKCCSLVGHCLVLGSLLCPCLKSLHCFC